MKAFQFNQKIANVYGIPLKTVTVYARLLKEAGLLTTGARGRNAPEMTPLDAARITIAILTTDGPSKCVDRVRRFGPLKYRPDFNRKYTRSAVMQNDTFNDLFKSETLEGVVAEIFSLCSIDKQAAIVWFNQNAFHLRISDFNILAEIFFWSFNNKTLDHEIIIPFKGDPNDDQFEPISGVVRTERSISWGSFVSLSLEFAMDKEQNKALTL